MTERITSEGSWRPGPVLHAILFAYAAMIGIQTGAAAFVTRTVFPLWTASPEAVMSWKPDSPFYLEEGTFFMYASPTTLLLSIVTLIAGWKAAPQLRKWLRMSTIIYMIIFIWSVAYFIPVQAVMKGDAGAAVPRDELITMLRNFVNLNYLRLLALVFSVFTALHALGISYRMKGS